MDTQKELLQLTKKMMEMDDFLDASKNLQIISEEWASPAKAWELAAWTDLLSKWYLSIVPEDREKKSTVALLFDLCDAMLDMGCECSTVLADAQRHHRDTNVVYLMMREEFPYLEFDEHWKHAEAP